MHNVSELQPCHELFGFAIGELYYSVRYQLLLQLPKRATRLQCTNVQDQFWFCIRSSIRRRRCRRFFCEMTFVQMEVVVVIFWNLYSGSLHSSGVDGVLLKWWSWWSWW